MLVPLLPEQVSEEWNIFAPLIAESLPPQIGFSFKGMSNVLRAILVEDLVVWAYYNEQDNLQFVMSTTVIEDKITYISSLLIYSFTSVGHVRKSHMKNVFETISKYCRSVKCDSIIAYSQQEPINQFLATMGADISNRLIVMEV